MRARVHGDRPRRPRPSAYFSVFGALMAVVILAGSFPVNSYDIPSTPVLRADRFTLPGLAAAVPASASAELVAGAVPLTVSAPVVVADQTPGVQNQTQGAIGAILDQQANAAQPTASVDGGGNQTERIPIFFEYEVQSGDTVIDIAQAFGISRRHVEWNNVDVLEGSTLLQPGMVLQIPSVEGIIHSVRSNETVTEIAARYDADWRDIVSFRANNLADDPNNIRSGVLILVPGGRIVPVAPSIRPTVPGTVGASGWAWPLDSRYITSQFGPSHPLGIDIGAGMRSPVYAANAGTVDFVGGNPCCSYGYHIIIDHGDGYETLYAHLHSFNVVIGQSVSAGDVIGWVGMTGRTTGPHLHFELRRHGQYMDPLGWLP